MRLDARRPSAPSRSTWRGRLGLELTDAAWGIHRVVNENMAGAARVHGIERGKDLRGYPALRLRRRGPGARLAGGAHPARAARARAVRRGRDLGLRAPGRAARLRLRAHRAAAHWPRPTGTRSTGSSPRWRTEGRAHRCAAPAWPTGTSACAASPRCATWARATRWTWRSRPGRSSPAAWPRSRRRSRPPIAPSISRTPAGRADRGAQLARRRLRPAPAISRSPAGRRRAAPPRRAPRRRHRRAYFPEARGYVETPGVRPLRAGPGRAPSRGPPSSRSASRPPSSARARLIRVDDGLDAHRRAGVPRRRGDRSDHARHLLEPADRRRQRAGGRAHAHLVHLDRARGGRSLGRRLRPRAAT